MLFHGSPLQMIPWELIECLQCSYFFFTGKKNGVVGQIISAGSSKLNNQPGQLFSEKTTAMLFHRYIHLKTSGNY